MQNKVYLGRLRKNSVTRGLVAQTTILAKDLIMPCFVVEGRNKREPITTMPGIFRFSIDNLADEVEELSGLGVKAVLLFGVTGKKDNFGSQAYAKNGIVQRAIREIKKNIKDIAVISDVCLCGYIAHGHCRIIKNAFSDVDETLKALAKIAVAHAEAGADLVAPSAMSDGQVGVIRQALDKNGFRDTGILAYSAKYASSFYGPFRDALGSSPKFGDRKNYQMDFRNRNEALREIEADINQGADIVMVKPASLYLDIIYRAKQKFNITLAAYSVSAEYSLIKLGAAEGLFSEKEAVLETLTAIRRAGADLIITYHAKQAAEWLKDI